MEKITELYETIDMMKSEDYNERFKAEYHQLKIRGEKLQSFLERYKNNELPFKPNCSYDLLNRQLKEMGQYLSYLEERAEIESVGLK